MQGRAWVLGSMLELQNTGKIRLYSEMSSTIMFCICCFPRKGEDGCTFSETFGKGFFLRLTCVPSAPTELRSALRHTLRAEQAGLFLGTELRNFILLGCPVHFKNVSVFLALILLKFFWGSIQ